MTTGASILLAIAPMYVVGVCGSGYYIIVLSGKGVFCEITSDCSTVTLMMRNFTFPLLTILTVFVFVVDLSLGSVAVPLSDVARILLGQVPARTTWEIIVLTIRLPKALTAALAGAALATGGLQMQTLFRNPLAGPFVLGISAGASLGAALVVVGASTVSLLVARSTLLGHMSMALAATMGAFTVMLLILIIARQVRNTTTLLVVGLMIGYAAGALVSILLYFARAEEVQAYVIWTFGSFGGVTWPQLKILAAAIGLGLALAVSSIKSLNALLLGEMYAISMGVHVGRARTTIITSTALLAGTVTAFCGPIAFLGVAVPHLARSLLRTSDHWALVPGVILMGALVALIADIVASLPGYSTILPLNAVTSLLGAPVVIWIILQRQRSFPREAS